MSITVNGQFLKVFKINQYFFTKNTHVKLLFKKNYKLYLIV